MERDTLYSIGELSRRTGLTVKTIRFYSDKGIVPPTDRTPAGYRLYGLDALARLDLVRTLRDLGLDLVTVRNRSHLVRRRLPSRVRTEGARASWRSSGPRTASRRRAGPDGACCWTVAGSSRQALPPRSREGRGRSV